MTGDSHFRGSEKDRSRREKKENGICKQLNDEEYERDKAEITVHLELLMELLQRNKKD